MRFSTIFLLSCPPGKSHPQVYQEGIEQLAAAEALGFHTLWFTEHRCALEHRQVLDSMQLFAAKVMPQLA